MQLQFILGLLMGAAGFLFAALGISRLKPDRLEAVCGFCRNSKVGVILAAGALALCVPQAAPIAWDWLANILWVLVIVFSVLAYLYLDYLTARAIGGLLILGAYYYVNMAFALHAPISEVGTVLAFLLGVAGMFISAKPYLLRDFLIKCTTNARLRAIASLLLLFYAWYLAAVMILTAVKR